MAVTLWLYSGFIKPLSYKTGHHGMGRGHRHLAWPHNPARTPRLIIPHRMTKLKLVQGLCGVLLVLSASRGGPVSGRCVEETFCMRSLEEYYYHVTNMPNKLNERSIAAWTYVTKTDLNRVPQVIHEAKCLSSHSCGDMESPLSLETIPISVKMPVLRKTRSCSTYALEFESVAIACICATPRRF